MKEILGVIALLSMTVHANMGGSATGVSQSGSLSAFIPKNAEKIEMQTEDLQIELLSTKARVRVEYTLHNPGWGTVVEAGFPSESYTTTYGSESTPRKDPPPSQLRRFSVYLDGKPVDVSLVAEKPQQSDVRLGGVIPQALVSHWHTFRLKLARKSTHTVRIEYEAPYSSSEVSVSSDGQQSDETFAYSLSPAAVWKGPIQRGKVTIRAVGVPAAQVGINLSKRFRRDGDQWTWEFADLEPGLSDDLKIVARPGYHSYWRDVDGGFKDMRVDFREAGGRWTMRHRFFRARASSTHPPDGAKKYDAMNLVRGSQGSSAWVEGAKGHGVGESLELELETPRKVSGIGISNGYVESEALYEANGRVAEMEISINGQKPFTAAIPDERYFEIPVPGEAPVAREIKLTIKKVYPGAQFEDTAISGLKLITPLSKAPKLAPSR